MVYTNLKLVALDLDGTLTQHKTKLEDFNKRALDRLSDKYKLVIIGAGSCNRIYEQINCYPIDIIGNYGMQHSEVKNGQLIITKDYSVAIDIEDVNNRIERLRCLLGYTDYKGNSVEYHNSGMITFPLIGTGAILEQKLKFDPDRKKRRAIYSYVKEVFKEYTVFIGGTSSFDIVPPPFNKKFALDEYSKIYDYTKDNIIYIGDDYGIGGNDEQIYKSDIGFLCINDYKSFSRIIRNIL